MSTLRVPGATLHYKVRGSGPLLLLISGGSADPDLFDGVGALLGDRFTIATYDPRGNSRSPLDGPLRDLYIEELADDAHLLLAELTDEPAYVFGSSSGALTALELLVKHSDQARLIVAHEPPAFGLLPDAEEHYAFFESVHATYLSEGADAAMRLFGKGIGEERPGRPPTHTPNDGPHRQDEYAQSAPRENLAHPPMVCAPTLTRSPIPQAGWVAA